MYKTYRGALTAAERQHRPKRLTAGRLPGAPAWSAAPMSTAWEIRVRSVVRGRHAFGPAGARRRVSSCTPTRRDSERSEE